MDDQTVIALEKVSRVYRLDALETHALAGVDLTIRKGEYVAISGPSGCGKSTLLGILGLLDTPTSGRYLLDGQPVEQLKPTQRARVRRSKIGFVFQSFNLIGDLNVLENVELPLSYQGVGSKERKERAYAALEQVKVAHRAAHKPTLLSGGQQQRVAVARAIVGNPSLLLADEPTGNLDSENGNQVMQILADLHAGGATICMVTHDPRYADFAQRTIELFDGKVLSSRSQAVAAQ